MLEELAGIGAKAGAMLKSRKQTIAVVDGSTGGLISASLLAMPGASAFFLGGSVIYSLKGRRIALGHEPGSLRGFTSATEPYALAQARLIRERLGGDWGIAETGASGGSAHPLGVASGTSAIGLVGPDGIEVSTVVVNASDDRLANMQIFTRAALVLLRDTLAAQAGA